jgi:hypothetical protein
MRRGPDGPEKTRFKELPLTGEDCVGLWMNTLF